MKCIHLVWDKISNQFLGINSFGIRLRHECFDRWIREKRSIPYILSHLAEANFDPEFFPRYESEIMESFAFKFPQLELNSRLV